MTAHGYDYGLVPPSPVGVDDLGRLEAAVLWSEADAAALARAGEVLEPQVEEILDLWYGFVASHPHLVAYFSTPEGAPIGEYLEAVRPRFGQWILDTCRRPRDAEWLAYQEEIARRHTADKKNRTDGVDSLPYVPLRYLVAFIYPITATIKDFLARGGDDEATVEAMHQAWFKAVVMQAALWARPYAPTVW